jgi:hypothetical protein
MIGRCPAQRSHCSGGGGGNELSQLAWVFVDIALHRKGPDALPASRFLFGLVLVAYLTLSLLALQINWPLRRSAGLAVVDVGFYLIFFGLVLQVAHRSARYWQTVTALLGAETFLSCLALPLLWLRTTAGESGAGNVLVTALLALILLWSIDIAGFVLSRALDRAYIVGVLIMLGYVISSTMLGELLLPSPG